VTFARFNSQFPTTMFNRFVFFLSPRVVDMDSYLPLGMELKRHIPSADIRFITFGSQNFEFIKKNTTLMKGIEQAGTLHYLGSSGGVVSRALRRISAFLSISALILRGNVVLFHGRQFTSFPYNIWYLLARLTGSRGIVLARVRLTDSGLHERYKERFASLSRGRKSIIARVFGRDADGLIHYHERQSLYLQSLYRYGDIGTVPTLCMGMPNMYPAWRDLVKQEARSLAHKLRVDGVSGGLIYAVIATKSFSSTALRTLSSVDETFVQLLDCLERLRPDATILIRLHPLALGERYIADALATRDANRIQITFAHPEVLALVCSRLFINAPTNVCYTTVEAKFIDVSDYTPEDIVLRNSRSFADGHNVLWVDPRSTYFNEAMDVALQDEIWTTNPELDSVSKVLYGEPPVRLGNLLEWIKATSLS